MDPRGSDTVRRVLLQMPNRRRIFEAVVAMPGIHLRGLSRCLGLALGSVEHHVRQLEKHGIVFRHKTGRRHCCFAAGQVDEADAQVLHTLRKPIRSRLLHAMLDGEPRGVCALAFKVNEPTTTVSYNLRSMRDKGLLDQVRVGRESLYFVRDPQRVARLLHDFQPGEGAAPDEAFAGVVDRASQREAGAEDEALVAMRMA